MASLTQSTAWSQSNGTRPPTTPPPAGSTASPRMLRVEFKGQPYDWFNLDEMGDLVKSEDFVNTLRENIVHYFSVPYDCQAIFDEEGMLSSAADFARALKGPRPCIKVWDVREMPPDVRDQAAQRLSVVAAEVARSQRILGAVVGRPGPGSRPVSPWPLRRGSHGEVEPMAPCPGGMPCPGVGPQTLIPAVTPIQEPRTAFGGGFTPPAPPPHPGMPGMFPPAAPPPGAYGLPPRPMMPPGVMGPVLPPGGLPPGPPGGLPPGPVGSWAPPPMGQVPPHPVPMEPIAVPIGSVPGLRHYDVGARQPWQEGAQVLGRDCIEVTLAKDPSDANTRFGFANVPSVDGRHLLITWVDVNGLLARWNVTCPDQAVCEGDLICAVNGAAEDVEAMRMQLQHEVVRMLVRRGNGPRRRPSLDGRC